MADKKKTTTRRIPNDLWEIMMEAAKKNNRKLIDELRERFKVI